MPILTVSLNLDAEIIDYGFQALENNMAYEKKKAWETLEAERRKSQDLENQLTQQKEVGAARCAWPPCGPLATLLLHLCQKWPTPATH